MGCNEKCEMIHSTFISSLCITLEIILIEYEFEYISIMLYKLLCILCLFIVYDYDTYDFIC